MKSRLQVRGVSLRKWVQLPRLTLRNAHDALFKLHSRVFTSNTIDHTSSLLNESAEERVLWQLNNRLISIGAFKCNATYGEEPQTHRGHRQDGRAVAGEGVHYTVRIVQARGTQRLQMAWMDRNLSLR